MTAGVNADQMRKAVSAGSIVATRIARARVNAETHVSGRGSVAVVDAGRHRHEPPSRTGRPHWGHGMILVVLRAMSKDSAAEGVGLSARLWAGPPRRAYQR